MDTNELLEIIFSEHDRLSHDTVFSQEIADRERAFVQAEAIRVLISEIGAGFKQDDQATAFRDATLSHVEAVGKGMFYKRKLNLNE